MKKNKKIFSIAIDGNEANVKNRVGTNVYAFEMLSQLEKLTKNYRKYSVTVLLSNKPMSDLPKKRKGWSYTIVTPKKFWTQWALPIHLFFRKKRYDVFYTPSHYAPRISYIPYVNTIHDLAYLEYPDQFSQNDLLKLEQWSKYSVKKAKKTIAVSKFTKREVVKHYNKKAKDIVIASPSIVFTKPATKKKISSFFKRNKISQPYFLYLGTIQPRKNISSIIEAFEQFSRSHAFTQLSKVKSSMTGKNDFKKNHKSKKPKLVIAGKVGWLAEDILEKIKSSPFKKQIILTGFVPTGIKQELYSRAMCSTLVGFYEGFGIPALESLSVGTIPIVSNISSLPEVVGDAGIKVDPRNINKISNAFKKVWRMSNRERATYNRKAQEQVNHYSWQKSAKTVLKTLEQVTK